MHSGLWARDMRQSEWSPAQREGYISDVAMIVVAAPHICSFAWLLCVRSSHGLLCAFGCSLALEAALLWWFLSDSQTPRRIMCQTLGLALCGLLLVARTLLDYSRHRRTAGMAASEGGVVTAGGPAGRTCGKAAGELDEGGARKDEGTRIIGAEQWLIAWSMSSWAALLYGAPCIFALLRQGVDAAMATFGCYLLFIALCAQFWVFVRRTDGDVASLGQCNDSATTSPRSATGSGLASAPPANRPRSRRREQLSTRRSLEACFFSTRLLVPCCMADVLGWHLPRVM